MAIQIRAILDFATRAIVPGLIIVALIDALMVINKFDSDDVDITYGIQELATDNNVPARKEPIPYIFTDTANRFKVNMYDECRHGHTSISNDDLEAHFVTYLKNHRPWIVGSIAALSSFHFFVIVLALFWPMVYSTPKTGSNKEIRNKVNKQYAMVELFMGIFGVAATTCAVLALCWFLAAAGARDDCGLSEVHTGRAGYTFATDADSGKVYQDGSVQDQWTGAGITAMDTTTAGVLDKEDAIDMCTRLVTRLGTTVDTNNHVNTPLVVDGDFQIDPSQDATTVATHSVSASRMAAFLLNCNNVLSETAFAGGNQDTTKKSWLHEAKKLEDAAKYIKHHTQAVVILTALSIMLLVFHMVGNRTAIRDKATGYIRVVLGTHFSRISSVLATNAWILITVGATMLSFASRDRKDHVNLAYKSCALRFSDDVVSSDRSEEKSYDGFYIGGIILALVSYTLSVVVIFLFRNTISTTIEGQPRNNSRFNDSVDWGDYLNSIIKMNKNNFMVSLFLGFVYTSSLWIVFQPLAKSVNDMCPQVPLAHVEQHVSGYLVVVIGAGMLIMMSMLYSLFGFAGLVRAGILPKFWNSESSRAFQVTKSYEEFRAGEKITGYGSWAFNKNMVTLLEATHA
jgi:hypothetical protein